MSWRFGAQAELNIIRFSSLFGLQASFVYLVIVRLHIIHGAHVLRGRAGCMSEQVACFVLDQ